MSHKFPYLWNLSEGYPAKGIQYNGLKVFGTFICCGGSTMGYKLSGYDHLGGVEIDKKISAVYKANHHPKYLFTEDLRAFNQCNDLPAELYGLDILDGSPPCSTFSMAGKREKVWGIEKKFTEGQVLQTLDDLVFVYCNTIKKLKPKVFILENVKGLIQAKARAYVHQIIKIMDDAGYACQIFLFNAASMGVPQRRERVFIIGRKKELWWPDLKMQFDEPLIKASVIIEKGNQLTATQHFSKKRFGDKIIEQNKVFPTILVKSRYFYDDRHYISGKCLAYATSFPKDYNYLINNDYIDPRNGPQYILGMSVPPVMMAQISHQIYLQWFLNFTEKLQRW